MLSTAVGKINLLFLSNAESTAFGFAVNEVIVIELHAEAERGLHMKRLLFHSLAALIFLNKRGKSHPKPRLTSNEFYQADLRIHSCAFVGFS